MTATKYTPEQIDHLERICREKLECGYFSTRNLCRTSWVSKTAKEQDVQAMVRTYMQAGLTSEELVAHEDEVNKDRVKEFDDLVERMTEESGGYFSIDGYPVSREEFDAHVGGLFPRKVMPMHTKIINCAEDDGVRHDPAMKTDDEPEVNTGLAVGIFAIVAIIVVMCVSLAR